VLLEKVDHFLCQKIAVGDEAVSVMPVPVLAQICYRFLDERVIGQRLAAPENQVRRRAVFPFRYLRKVFQVLHHRGEFFLAGVSRRILFREIRKVAMAAALVALIAEHQKDAVNHLATHSFNKAL
jgi:hypothetical protein